MLIEQGEIRKLLKFQLDLSHVTSFIIIYLKNILNKNYIWNRRKLETSFIHFVVLIVWIIILKLTIFYSVPYTDKFW